MSCILFQKWKINYALHNVIKTKGPVATSLTETIVIIQSALWSHTRKKKENIIEKLII